MIEYYKVYLSLYKIIDNKVYWYDYYNTGDWNYIAYPSRQHLLTYHALIQLTLLDMVMMGIPE